MSEHTPGPWRVAAHSRYKHSISGGMWSNFAKVVTRMRDTDADSVEGLANARLIAAAPELLDALIAVTDRVAMLQGDLAPTVAQARAAIAKATGAK